MWLQVNDLVTLVVDSWPFRTCRSSRAFGAMCNDMWIIDHFEPGEAAVLNHFDSGARFPWVVYANEINIVGCLLDDAPTSEAIKDGVF